ncbi:Coiled-coil domain-containing protein 17 [Podochytrium sp. JEL0797]|nr:Coiled-coil domain-containing protein 17 [Podochytrium sp. JEL0797]
MTFEEIDLISIPPYDEYRGFSLFLDIVTGVPYFGGGSSVQIQVFYTVLNGSMVCCPVDSVNATCHRQAVSFIGKSIIREVQRFYDIPPTANHRLLFQFSLSDSNDLRPEAEIRPVAWTSFDLFKDDMDLNHGRWRLNLFYPPVDFKTTTYHLHSTKTIIPNMLLYIRVVHPMLQVHHKRVDLSTLDLRNSTGSEYRVFKPSYNCFEVYDAVRVGLAHEKRSLSIIVDGPDGDLLGSRERFGSKLIGSTNTLNMNQVLYCTVGIRVEQLKNLNVPSGCNVRARIRVGTQLNPWVSGIAEVGFVKGNYGWPDDFAEFVCTDIPIIADTPVSIDLVGSMEDEDEKILTPSPIVIQLFQKLEDKSIVVNEGFFNPTATISNTDTPCEFAIRIYSDARVPSPFLFDSKRLDKPLPKGAWLAVDRDPTVPYMNASENGGLESFKLSIDGFRFLPENCTICRLQCQIMDRDQTPLDSFDPLDLLPDLTSPTYFPVYTNSTTIHLPPSPINGTLTAVIKIYTIDRHTRQLLTVGIALFNFFVGDGGEQPESVDEQPVFLNEGYHQVPVYAWSNKMGFKETGCHVNAIKSQRVPCCSLLLRVSSSEDLPVKQYQDGVYISTKCKPLPYESGLFYFVSKERTIQESVASSLSRLKQEVQAANDEALVVWMSKRITKEKGVIPVMDYSCLLKFHEGWGFKIAVDMADNLKNKAFSIAIVSLSPPGLLYAAKRKSLVNSTMDDVMYNQKLDFSTTVRSPKWQDGFLVRNLGSVSDILLTAFHSGIKSFPSIHGYWL